MSKSVATTKWRWYWKFLNARPIAYMETSLKPPCGSYKWACKFQLREVRVVFDLEIDNPPTPKDGEILDGYDFHPYLSVKCIPILTRIHARYLCKHIYGPMWIDIKDGAKCG
jgi:hypothetical protein